MQMSGITQGELNEALRNKLRDDTEEALLLASHHAAIKVIERILLHGNVSVNCRNSAGATPLHVAAISGNAESCKALLSFGADVNALWDGSTPLHLAVSECRDDIVAILVAHGANINKPDALHFTPLHLAAIRNHRTLTMYLIRAGGDPTLKDGDGKTVAQRWNHAALSYAQDPAYDSFVDEEKGSLPPPSPVGSEALMQRFKSFSTFVEEKRVEPVTPTQYALRYYHSISTTELREFLEQHVDPMGIPPEVVAKKIQNLLREATRKSPDRLYFDHFCVIWLAAVREGFL